MKTFILIPRDVLFLRDARPMEASDAGLGANWPRPDQLYNALHHAFLTQWPKRQAWEGDEHTRGLTCDKNQDSSFRFGALKTFGPFPQKGGEVYLPSPLDANMRVIRCEGTDLPRPLTHAFLPNEKTKDSPPAWIPASLYREYLAGKTIDWKGIKDSDLYGVERNIGIAIDPETGATKEHKFYQAEYLRLQKDVSLYFEADCVLKLKREDKEHDVFTQGDLPRQVVMGGQQGTCAMVPANIRFPAFQQAVTTRWLRWTLLTPAVFTRGWLPGWIGENGRVMLPRGRVERLPGETRQEWKARQNAAVGFDASLIAARVGKPAAFSGWDLQKGGAKPTLLAVPAGSSYVFACKDGNEAKALANVLNHPNRRSDSFGEKGFGVGVCSSITVQE